MVSNGLGGVLVGPGRGVVGAIDLGACETKISFEEEGGVVFRFGTRGRGVIYRQHSVPDPLISNQITIVQPVDQFLIRTASAPPCHIDSSPLQRDRY